MKLENVLAAQMCNFTILTIHNALTCLLKHFKKIHLTMTTKRQKKTMARTTIIFLEKKNHELIVMNDAPGLTDKSNGFSNFLTVIGKFGYISLYIFHIIYVPKSIWQMILSQTKVSNIFPSSIHLVKRVEQDSNSLVFRTNSMINVTKNGGTKICKAAQKVFGKTKRSKRKN